MVTETRIYDYGDDWPRKVVISHGCSESVVLYDSSWPEPHDSWGQPIKSKKTFKERYIESLEKEILSP